MAYDQQTAYMIDLLGRQNALLKKNNEHLESISSSLESIQHELAQLMPGAGTNDSSTNSQ